MSDTPDPGATDQYIQITHATAAAIGAAGIFIFGWFKRLLVELYVIKSGGKTREGEEAPKVVYTHAFDEHRTETDRRIHELDKRLSDASARQDVRIDALFQAKKNGD